MIYFLGKTCKRGKNQTTWGAEYTVIEGKTSHIRKPKYLGWNAEKIPLELNLGKNHLYLRQIKCMIFLSISIKLRLMKLSNHHQHYSSMMLQLVHSWPSMGKINYGWNYPRHRHFDLTTKGVLLSTSTRWLIVHPFMHFVFVWTCFTWGVIFSRTTEVW